MDESKSRRGSRHLTMQNAGPTGEQNQDEGKVSSDDGTHRAFLHTSERAEVAQGNFRSTSTTHHSEGESEVTVSAASHGFSTHLDGVDPTWEDKSLSSWIRRLFWFFGLSLGLMEVITSRFSTRFLLNINGTLAPNIDGNFYLDLARAYLERDWNTAISAYWSPLYAWLLAAGIWLSRSSWYWESTIAHIISFLVFAGSMGAFELFLRELCRHHRARAITGEAVQPIPVWAMRAFGYSLCLYAGLVWISVGALTPDQCVAIVVYLTAALMLRIQLQGSRLRWYVLLGLLLGVGYLTKAVLLPLGIVSLAATPFLAVGEKLGARLLRTLLVGFLFALIASPLVVTLSRAKGRFTTGDTGKIAYAEFVDGLPGTIVWWQGQGDFGIPKHSVRKVQENPVVYEFATPVGGTYPPWYDPSYWLDGVRARLLVGNQIRVLLAGAQAYVACILTEGGLVVAFVVLLMMDRKLYSFIENIATEWPSLLFAIAGLAMYAIVLVETRYVASFLVIAAVSCLAGIRVLPLFNTRRVLTALALGVAVVNGIGISIVATRTLPSSLFNLRHEQWEVAQALSQHGLRAGDRVATIVDHQQGDYWAHLARVKIVEDIPTEEIPKLALLDSTSHAQLVRVLREPGAKAIVTTPAPPPGTGFRWDRLGNTEYFISSLTE